MSAAEKEECTPYPELKVTTPHKVFVNDEKGPGGANHRYYVLLNPEGERVPALLQHVHFQRGPRNVEGSYHGVLEDDLLAILEHRMQCFQAGSFVCAENAEALRGIQIARQAMKERRDKRLAQGVLGKNETHKS
jgi:hypothetical protein